MLKRAFLQQLFADFERHSLDYFVIGEYQSLPEDTGGSDIDIIVSQNDAEQLIHVLHGIVDYNGVTLASHYSNQHAIMFRLMTLHWGVQIDILIGGLYYRGVNYYPLENLKKHVINHNGIRVIERKYGFCVEFFKEIIHNGHVKSKYCEALLWAMQNNESLVRSEVVTCFSDDAWELIKGKDSVNELNKIGKQLRQVVLHSLKMQIKFTCLSYYVKRLQRLFQPRPGYVLIVEGTDGSGKSTIINALVPWLDDGFHKSVVYNHLRPHVLPDIAVVLGKRKCNMKVEVVDNPHAGKESGFIGSLMRWMYYLHDYTWGYLFKVYHKIKIRSYFYIFDRYYYDYYIDSKRSLTSLPRWILRFGELFVPKPDVILCLGGDPEKIYARKPETSLEEVARQTIDLKKFAAQRKNAVWIDTTQPIENSIRDAKSAILNMMSTRFKDVL